MPRERFRLTEARCPHCDCSAALMASDSPEAIAGASISSVRGVVGSGRTDDCALPVVLPEPDRRGYVCPACGKDFAPSRRRVSGIRFPEA